MKARADGVEPERLTARFFHLNKLPVVLRSGLDPVAFDPITAGLSGIGVAELRQLRREFDEAVDEAVDGLASEAWVRDALDALPFRDGDVVVALGDSITDDLLSWAVQLDRLIRRVRPELAVRVQNAGFTGNTTQEAISRIDTVLRQRPAWVLQMLGTNDARRHGRLSIPTTSRPETRRNLRILRRFVEEDAGARHVPMTPPPADEVRARAWAPFAEEQLSWREKDVDAVADLVRALDGHTDVHRAFTDAADPDLLLPDGIHPSIAGHSLIVRTVLQHLADASWL